MNLHTFESEIDPVILGRGRDYYANGLVTELDEEDGRYCARVAGSGLYTVEAALDASGEVLSIRCDCPYEFGEHCKHEVAVLLAIREQHGQAPQSGQSKPKKKKSDLHTVLSGQSKDALVALLLDLSRRYDGVEESALLRFSPADDEVAMSRKLVRRHMRPGRDGFFDWNQVSGALEGADTVLEKARGYAASDYERTVRLCLVVLPEAIKLLSYCDDSNGEVGDVISQCVEIMESTLNASLYNLPPEKRRELFQLILEESRDSVYEEWTESRLDLLRILCGFHKDPPLLNQLQELLEAESHRPRSPYSHYYEEEIARLRLFLMATQGADKARGFLMENLHFPSFREAAIRQAMEARDFTAALQLALEGVEQDKALPGLVSRWKKVAFAIYEETNDTLKLREMARHFVLEDHDGFDYYEKLKATYALDQWPDALVRLLRDFEKQTYLRGAYIPILLAEGEYDRLLRYCQAHPHALEQLGKEFPESYREPLEQIFRPYILHKASEANDRSQYREVCKILKNYGKICGKPGMAELVQQLKGQYPRRPAFQDELGKLV